MVGVFLIADQYVRTGNWLDAGGHRGLVEFNQSKHIELIGNRHSRHSQLLHALDKLLYSQGTVQ